MNNQSGSRDIVQSLHAQWSTIFNKQSGFDTLCQSFLLLTNQDRPSTTCAVVDNFQQPIRIQYALSIMVTEAYRAQTNTTKRTKRTKENICRGNKEVRDNKGKTPGRSHWGVSGPKRIQQSEQSEQRKNICRGNKEVSDNKGKTPGRSHWGVSGP
jgi:hypothetical protein